MAKSGYHLTFKESEKEKFSAIKAQLGAKVDFEAHGAWAGIYDVVMDLSGEELVIFCLAVCFTQVKNIDNHAPL